MSKKDNKKSIPFKNYVKLALIIILVVLVSFLFRNWYIGRINYELNIPVITDTLIRKVNTDEVYNYIHENENAIIYVGVASDENCRSFEKEFNNIIKERSLEDKITYLNITAVKDKMAFIDEFNKTYDISLKGYPSIIVFNEGKVKDIITVQVGYDLNIDDVNKFLDKNGVDLVSL